MDNTYDLASQYPVLLYLLRLLVLLALQQELYDIVKRLLDDNIAWLLNHIKVLEEAIPEEVVNDVEAVLISAWVIGWGAKCGLYHICFSISIARNLLIELITY